MSAPRPRIGGEPNWPHTVRDIAFIALIIAVAALGGAG